MASNHGSVFMYNFSYLFGIQIFYSCLTHDSGGIDRGLLLCGVVGGGG